VSKFLIALFFLLINCSSVFTSCTVHYTDGEKEKNVFVHRLKEQKIKFVVLKHDDNIYEIRYKEK
jgi:hypothetical protein